MRSNFLMAMSRVFRVFSQRVVRPVQISRGFTLMETLIVVVIIAVLGSLVIPRLTGMTEKAQRAEAVQMLGVLRTAVNTYLAMYPEKWSVRHTNPKWWADHLQYWKNYAPNGIPDPYLTAMAERLGIKDPNAGNGFFYYGFGYSGSGPCKDQCLVGAEKVVWSMTAWPRNQQEGNKYWLEQYCDGRCWKNYLPVDSKPSERCA